MRTFSLLSCWVAYILPSPLRPDRHSVFRDRLNWLTGQTEKLRSTPNYGIKDITNRGRLLNVCRLDRPSCILKLTFR
jgi:hypothetical protein